MIPAQRKVPRIGVLLAVTAAIVTCSPGVASASSWGHIDARSGWSSAPDGNGSVQTIAGRVNWWKTARIPFACPVGALRDIDRTDSSVFVFIGAPLGRTSGQLGLTNSAPIGRNFHLVLRCA